MLLESGGDGSAAGAAVVMGPVSFSGFSGLLAVAAVFFKSASGEAGLAAAFFLGATGDFFLDGREAFFRPEAETDRELAFDFPARAVFVRATGGLTTSFCDPVFFGAVSACFGATTACFGVLPPGFCKSAAERGAMQVTEKRLASSSWIYGIII
ncbi:membrane hypothetical protein [Candidatus Nitrotoga fabula]|uniref:Uncharacterized protein n=1 Tax=Candidatus Nitrotoga fabula TaxID=2182327 RepID=A0A916F8V9_9PROT|nr:membrane hypothetical protein [Candidatus Nitrotoga fabula]